MTDEHWLRELAQVNREKQDEERNRLDERWDRLAAGTLTAAEEAELRALAETSTEAREAYEAFRPLGPEFQASVVQAIRAQGLPEAETAKKEPAKLLSFPRRTVFAGWSAAAAAAAAAVLMIFLRAPAPLPDYADPYVTGGTSTMRGERPGAEQVRSFAPGDPIRIILRQKTEAPAKGLEAQCFLSRAQELRSLEVQSEFDPKGSVKMEGSIGGDVEPGAWTLWVVVCRRGELPEPADLRSLSPGASIRQRDCVAVPREIRIQSRGP
ncbi:MAG TPA: hypothetical protein VGG03_12035 [Thermoanaerobaculia bacterium]|jgi:hypothetical protein